MIQLALAFFGLSALFMATGQNQRARRWAPVIGLCGQPFWIWFAFGASAWGLLALSIAYSVVYVRGIVVQWRTLDYQEKRRWKNTPGWLGVMAFFLIMLAWRWAAWPWERVVGMIRTMGSKR